MAFNPKVARHSGSSQKIDYTPGSAVSAGDVVIINGIAHFSELDIAANVQGSLCFSGGVWRGNKASGTVVAGDAIYYNTTGNPNVGTTGTGAVNNTGTGTFVGYAVAAAATADQFIYFVKANSQATQLRVVSAQATTVAASDTIVTGLAKVVAVVASLDSDPSDDPEWVSASIGDQAGTPAAGSFLLKSWKNTGGTDPTPAAATTFSKKVNYIAVGF
jgi:hypothetical protein